MNIRNPIIPTYIVVHLGAPDEAAKNITVPFIEYIKNVASGEIYPNWPLDAIKANVLAQISFALNRIYNEWYRSKGYNFDITSSPVYDQAYTENRSIFENIENIVEEIFNNYVVKNNQIQPYFTTYCDGRNKTCNGLSQWGTVSLANQGKNPLQILQYYYGNDISIFENAPVGDNTQGYPGYEIGLGSAGNPVLAIQRDLRRIRKNYPAIPDINNTLGIYDQETVNAVKEFQRIFDLPVTGIVNKATWYKIKYLYTSVKKLSDITTEGLSKDEVTFLYTDKLEYGDTGIEVEYVHYYLDALGFLDQDIPRLPTNSIYNDNTIAMVKAFQQKYGLPVTGIFTYSDWQVLKNTYNKILKNIPKEYQDFASTLYPGYFLTRNMSGDDILRLQKLLLEICRKKKNIPGVRVNGTFDELTEKSIYKLQSLYGFDLNGIVGPLLWRKIVELSEENN